MSIDDQKEESDVEAVGFPDEKNKTEDTRETGFLPDGGLYG